MPKDKKPKVKVPIEWKVPKGTADVLPKEQEAWRFFWQTGLGVSELHDFYFLETPLLETEGLFASGLGDHYATFEKTFYSLKDREGERLVLRFNPHVPALRSYLGNHLAYFSSPLKVYSFNPVFRQIKPEPGFSRQFREWSFDIIGEADPIYDGEIILAVYDLLRSLKLKGLKLVINNAGCRVCRPAFKQKLKNYYRPLKEELCKDCVRDLEENPYALARCKEEKCAALRAAAPVVLDYLCQNCNNHFKAVLELVEDNGIPYEPNPHLLPLNDYSDRTTFEFFAADYPLPIASGGRYDYLAEALKARFTPAVGGAVGMERAIEAMRLQGVAAHPKTRPRVFFVVLSDQAKKAALRFMNNLRGSGVAVLEVVGKKTLKAQLRIADRIGIRLALILGQKEVFEGTIMVRDMMTGAQETIVAERLVEEVKKRLK
jgi:histidyl-tRNA synthetase